MGSRHPSQDVWEHQPRSSLLHSARPLPANLTPLQATTAFSALLLIHPHDPGVLRELVPLLTSTGLYGKASTLYLTAFDHYRTICPHITTQTLPLISSFGHQDLETIADILNHLELYDRSIDILKRGVRWLQGREQETGWDGMSDDREFDLERKTRVGWERDARFLEEARVNELDVRLRLRLGVARMAKGDTEEAQVSACSDADWTKADLRTSIVSATSPSSCKRTSPSSPSSSARLEMLTTNASCTTMRWTSSRSWPSVRT